MIYPYPFSYPKNYYPYSKSFSRYHSYSSNSNSAIYPTNPTSSSCHTNSSDTIKEKTNTGDQPFFELFGIQLYFDDILLVCLIFFLYQEGVKDQFLFISLILLLLS